MAIRFSSFSFRFGAGVIELALVLFVGVDKLRQLEKTAIAYLHLGTLSSHVCGIDDERSCVGGSWYGAVTGCLLAMFNFSTMGGKFDRHTTFCEFVVGCLSFFGC